MTSISDKYKSFSDNLATDLFKAVVSRYGIPFDELWELYSNEKSENLQNIKPQKVETQEIEVSTTDILSMKVAELKALCKTRGLKVSGKKNDLLERLLGRKVDDKEVKSPVRKSPKKKSKSTTKEKDVVKKVKPPSLKISKNSNGEYMHEDSKLVFNPDTKKVFAKYIEGEGNQPLTKEDIELCNKFRFAYEMPDNLNVKRTKAEEARLENLLADEEEEVNQARLKRGAKMQKGDAKENETEKDIEEMVGEALKGNLEEVEGKNDEEEEEDDEVEYEEVVDDEDEVEEDKIKKKDAEEVEEDEDEEVEYEEVVEEEDGDEEVVEEEEEADGDEEVEYEEVEVMLDSDGNEIEYESEAEDIDDILNDSDFGSENDDEEEYE